jgi:hypothetical protein
LDNCFDDIPVIAFVITASSMNNRLPRIPGPSGQLDRHYSRCAYRTPFFIIKPTSPLLVAICGYLRSCCFQLILDHGAPFSKFPRLTIVAGFVPPQESEIITNAVQG